MRPELLNPLFAEIDTLDGVGPKVKKQLARLEIARVVDLLFHMPVQYVARRRVAALTPDMLGETIIASLTVDHIDDGDGRRPTRVRATDADGNRVTLVFFRDRGYARTILPPGERRTVSGRLDEYGGALQIVHPDHVVEEGGGTEIQDREPVYRLTEGLTNKRLMALIAVALDQRPAVQEWADAALMAKHDWPGWGRALEDVHAGAPGAARARLAYDELLADQIALLSIRAAQRRRRGRALVADDVLVDRFTGNLPYRLTGAQTRSIGEILGDMSQPAPMLRLLQGDVGAGKTAVALAAMLRAVKAGGQAAMLAPTELLARQHHATLTDMLTGLDVRGPNHNGGGKRAQTKALEPQTSYRDNHKLGPTHAHIKPPRN
ncbi:MAG: DEAD/DEAH box helicase, partial [Pseudomonadota bacterium]